MTTKTQTDTPATRKLREAVEAFRAMTTPDVFDAVMSEFRKASALDKSRLRRAG